MTRLVIILYAIDGLLLRTVVTALSLPSAHGAHHIGHRGPLWTVEPLLLEGQVRTFPVSVHSAQQKVTVHLTDISSLQS